MPSVQNNSNQGQFRLQFNFEEYWPSPRLHTEEQKDLEMFEQPKDGFKTGKTKTVSKPLKKCQVAVDKGDLEDDEEYPKHSTQQFETMDLSKVDLKLPQK